MFRIRPKHDKNAFFLKNENVMFRTAETHYFQDFQEFSQSWVGGSKHQKSIKFDDF